MNTKPVMITGGVTAAKGFKAAGIHCGIKKVKPDLAIVFSEVEAAAAGVFTKNVFQAAPVIVSREHLASGYAQGIVVNSGNANACTGPQGLADARQMAVLAGKALSLEPDRVVVSSTGLIGVPLPMDKISSGIEAAAKALFEEHQAAAFAPQAAATQMDAGTEVHPGVHTAAQAIMTTDTVPKELAVQVDINGVPVVVGGMAKGSGMIHPNMATMLAFITTDAAITPDLLKKALQQCTQRSFNRITVDGDTSTNDMVVVLANGQAGNEMIASETEDYFVFLEALQYVCTYLAKAIVRDGEGATKFIEVAVVNAPNEEDAALIAKSVAGSNLFKTAMFGEDANWGRIAAAAGYSGAVFDPEKVNIWLESPAGREQTTRNGLGLPFDEEKALQILREKEVKVTVDLQQGDAEAAVWTCDFSYEYVRINAEYRS